MTVQEEEVARDHGVDDKTLDEALDRRQDRCGNRIGERNARP
jgi:hypothetical protein